MRPTGNQYLHGLLNPLSSKSIVECCVMPVLLFGAESWILNPTLLQSLESFQAEIAKRILHPKFQSQLPTMWLSWLSDGHQSSHPPISSKLTFLLKSSNGDNSLSARVYRSLAVSDIESILHARQCRFLESIYKTSTVMGYSS